MARRIVKLREFSRGVTPNRFSGDHSVLYGKTMVRGTKDEKMTPFRVRVRRALRTVPCLAAASAGIFGRPP